MTEQLRNLLEQIHAAASKHDDYGIAEKCSQALSLLPTAGDASGVVEHLRDAMGKACSSGNVRLQQLQRRDVRLLAEAALATLPALSQQPVLRAGDVIKGTDPDFGDLVLMPLNQMQDIKDTCGEIVKKCQYPVSEAFLPEKKGLNDLKGDIFCLAEHAQLFAGNWTQRKRQALTTAQKQEG